MTAPVSIEPATAAASDIEVIDKGPKKKESKKKYFGRTAKVGALWSILRQAGHELIGIPTSMIMARLLAPAEFGITASAAFFITLSARLTQFGFNAAIVRIKELRPDHTSSVFVVNLTLGILSYAILFLAAPAIGDFLRSPEAGRLLRVAALIFLINPFGSVPSSLISRRMQFRYGTAGDWTDGAMSAAVMLTLAFKGYGYWSPVIGQLTGAGCRVLLKLYLTGWRPSFYVSRRALRELLSFGLGLQAKRLLEYATYNLDTLVVGRVLGMASLGFYDKAFSTMNRLVNRLTLGQAYFRIFSIIHEEPLRFRRAYSKLVLTISVIGLPAFAAAIVVAEPLFILMYGEQWLSAVLPFQMLCVGGILKLLNAYASQANEATGNIWPQVHRQALGAVSIVVGAFLGARMGGVTGAAIGVAIGMAIMTVAMQILIRRVTGLTWGEMLRPQIPGAACATLVVAALLAVQYSMPTVVQQPAAWQMFLAQTLVGTLVYGLFLLLNPFADLNAIVSESVDQLLPEKLAARVGRVRRWRFAPSR